MTANSSSLLRQELAIRAHAYARRHGFAYVESYGTPPTIVFVPGADSHGNFHPRSYAAILKDAEWRKRLAKVHTHAKALPRADHGKWMETDSCNSSDALLMSVFCHPDTLRSREVRLQLGLGDDALELRFGFRARVPLLKGEDRTEVDLAVGDLLIESKLTESGFQTKDEKFIRQYRDLDEVFGAELLPRTARSVEGYQLIRNILAAHHLGRRFCVILDERRPDLVEQYHRVQRAVRQSGLSTRCMVLTWQELSLKLPTNLKTFLAEKYGIAAPGVRVPLPESD